jgi:predicted DNA-binding transcriptional regulator YafY
VFDNLGPSIKSFEHVVGISGLDEEPMDVVLEFTPDQGRYIKTLPIHASQEIVEDNEDRLVVSLYVVNNFELRQRILGYGSSVLVLEPEELAEEIEEELRKNLGKYRERHGLS